MRIQKQFTVCLINKPGTLARLCRTLAGKKILILAIALSDGVDQCAARLVVNDSEKATAGLKRAGICFTQQSVVAGKISNKVGSLAKVASTLAARGINIDYTYGSATAQQNECFLVLKTSDLKKTVKILK